MVALVSLPAYDGMFSKEDFTMVKRIPEKENMKSLPEGQKSRNTPSEDQKTSGKRKESGSCLSRENGEIIYVAGIREYGTY